MKIRTCFVSNSSSSSFTCEACGATESGMDACPSDFNMSECKSGHCFCNSHIKKEVDYEKTRNEIKEDIENNNWLDKDEKETLTQELNNTSDEDLLDFQHSNLDYNVMNSMCPLCNFDFISDSVGYEYLKKRFGLTSEIVLEYIKKEFNSFDELRKYLKS